MNNNVRYSLSVCSYNMHGFNQEVHFLKQNIDLHDMWCLQEHCLYPSAVADFNDINTDYVYNEICDVNDDNVRKPGRPKSSDILVTKTKTNINQFYLTKTKTITRIIL